jgi:hypothetical protein
MERPPAVIVFTRAPRAGATKTRLIPALGPAGAAELHRCFILDVLGSLRPLPAHIIVAIAEPEDAEPVRGLAADACPSAELFVQSGADLGERISNSVGSALEQGYPRVAVVGTDAPDLPARLVDEALALSVDSDLVLGPCLDGGYYLVGMRELVPGLFRGIEWSSDHVLVDTLSRAKRRGLSVALLEPWYDVDTPEALDHLRSELSRKAVAGEPITCLRTWDYLCDLEGQDA